MTAIVASAASGAPAAIPSGASVRRPNTTGSTVAGMSMFTVPTMVGVRNRCSQESRAEIRIGTNEEATTSAASSTGPPSTRALTETPMKAAAGPIVSTCPDPIRPNRTACSAVQTPLTTTAPNTTQVR